MIAALLHFESAQHEWVPSAFAIAALAGPFLGYIAVLYGAPLLTSWPRVIRTVVLIVSSAAATYIGYTVLFLAAAKLMGRPLGYVA
jgi:hypothetical protein